MTTQGFAPVLAVALLLAAFPAAVQSIGVCYGVIGNNLPAASDVVKLYKSKGIDSMRIYFPRSDILQALTGSNIALTMDVANENLAGSPPTPPAAVGWVKQNVQAYPGVSFRYIAVGNEVTGDDTGNILPAMKNLNAALGAAGLGGVGVSTSVSQGVIANSYPPSNGVFNDDYMFDIVEYLASTGAPLLVNVYPYFAYVGDTKDISLNYATFQPGTTVTDDGSGLIYTSLFDAMVDSVYAALEDAGAPDVGVVVSETGWPSAGGFGASVSNAQTYNQKLISHVQGGTPKRPGVALETYVFAMFNENQKTGAETERHFGLFNPNKSPSYKIRFH
uniref:Beta-1,3-glucanase n=1 Tax=Oryza sativa TaxID=4530 RepID=Q9ZNY9_ORYSA|nr:beta-1,3-glucanase precursor [Oryza sativa Japonica Group]